MPKASLVHRLNYLKKQSSYIIFSNENKETLVYYNCPKNANSSGKSFFMGHLGIQDKFKFMHDDIPNYLQKKEDYDNKLSLVKAMPSQQPFSIFGDEINYKICFIRDPFTRFKSAYQNRILWHRDKNFGGLSVDEVLDRLMQKDFANGHFFPQTHFLGNDLSYYDLVCDISEIDKFENYVNNFFGNTSIRFPHIQKKTGGVNIEFTEKQIDLIGQIYESDLHLIKSYSASK